MERDRPAALVTLFWEDVDVRGEMRLTGDVVRHAQVRRLTHDAAIRLVNGRGRIGTGKVVEAGKQHLLVVVEAITDTPRPVSLEVLVPVADRDRMLLSAEKCVEFQITGWRPTYFARSQSVSPRGEGERFRAKVLARMRGALEQSGGAWLPDVHEEMEAADALGSISKDNARFMLHVDGAPLISMFDNGPTALAVGPEGGLERGETRMAIELGWRMASLGNSTLRFETAVIGAVATMQAVRQSSRSA